MARHRLVIISKNTLDASPVEVELAGMDYGIRSLVCRDAEETIRAVKGSDLIIDVGVPLPGAVIQKIDQSRGKPHHAFRLRGGQAFSLNVR